MSECMFSGGEADSVEHVVPKWLQSKYNLWNQLVVLPNGTTLPYRQVTVPVLTAHNSAFAEVENHLSEGRFSSMEAYLWALKLHIGFIYRDSNLRFYRNRPSSPTILQPGDFIQEIFLFRSLYSAWRARGKITPDPFGSVHVLDSYFDETDFDFFHCLVTSTVGVTIPGKFILAFLWDQGDSYRADVIRHWKEHHEVLLKNTPRESRRAIPYMAYHVFACESAYWMYRHRRPHTLVITQDSVLSVSPFSKTKGKVPDQQEYGMICKNFGLNLEEFHAEGINKYSQRRLPK